MRRLALFASILSLLSIALGAGALWYLSQPTQLAQQRTIRIAPGSSARHIGRQLEREGIVRSAAAFALTVRLMGVEQDLEAGTYRLDGRQEAAQIVRQLLRAPPQMRRVTIPEGLTRHEIAALLARQGVVDSSRFVALTQDAAFARQLGVEASTLEGYLFPETYFFALESSPEEVVGRLVRQFHRVFADSLRARLDHIGLDLHQAVTLASIVEREAQAPEERPVISGIFQRRLRLDRRLESCATVEYALGVHKKRLTHADLRIDSPYNTYRHRGLPPGPIGNPGRAALMATLFPAPTEYLYFVARGDGTHVFSRTNAEHERAKRQIRRQERQERRAALN